MKLQYEHKVVSSFLLFLEHELGRKANAYTNYSSNFYPISGGYQNYYTYAAPFKQFVFDSSITYSKNERSRGPQIPSGVNIGNEYLTPGTGSLVSIDYNKGQLFFSSDYPASQGQLPSANYAVKDFNIYLTNEPEHKLLFETQFKVAPKVSQIPTGLAADVQTYPALYVKNLDSHNEDISLGPRTVDTNMYIRVVALCDSAYLLDAVCSFMKDFGRRKMAILEANEQPFGPLGYQGGEAFSYTGTISGKFESEENHLLIHDVSISKRSQNQTDFKNLNSEVFVGFIDFTLKNIRDLD